MIVIQGGRLVTADGLIYADVAIDGVTVVEIGTIDPPEDARVVNGRGLVVGPGFVDLHVHFREPGQTWKEDIASGSAAAVAGGFTAVVMMPNTEPAVDSTATLRHLMGVAGNAPLEVVAAGALTRERGGVEMSALDDLYDLGVRLFTDDGDTLADAGVMRRVMRYLSDRRDVVIAQHAEERTLAGGGHLHEGAVSQTLGIGGLPSSAEEVILARDLVLAAETDIHYHAQHISTFGSVEIIRRAKESGLNVTAEVAPHHLSFTDSDVLTLDTNLKMYPPIRSERDRAALVGGLEDGTIDAVATDHAPHTTEEKDAPFEEAPRGVIGLETSLPVTLSALSGDVLKVFDRMSVRPAGIASLHRQGQYLSVGSPANLAIVDPEKDWIVDGFASKSENSPFRGMTMKGKIVATCYEGSLVYEEAS